MDSVEADAQLIKYRVRIVRGQTLDGIDWIVVHQNKLAEFRCGSILYDYVDSYDGDQIALKMPFLAYPDVPTCVENIVYR